MTATEAQKIGGKQGLIFAGLGILIAQLIMTTMTSSGQSFFKAFLWFLDADYKLNLFIGCVIMLFSGYYYGKIAGKAILIKHRNFILVGFLSAMAVLLTTAFLAGWVGFFQEGVDNIGTNDNPFEDYIFKPLFWITLFGIIPALLVGIWFGRQIKRKGMKYNKSIQLD